MAELGVDVGALWTKMVIVEGGRVLASGARRSTTNPQAIFRELCAELQGAAGLERAPERVAATGVGRKSIPGSVQMTDMTAFAKGARFLHPPARIVVDIGGQGVRLIELDAEGVMTGFATNDKCSTGTGCFLDIMAAALGVDPAYMGTASASAREPALINTSCTVFAESEVVTLVAKKRPKEEIIAGLNEMVAKKVVAMINMAGTRGDVVLCGGVAMNAGVVGAIERELGRRPFVPPQANMVGALGAALSLEGGR